MNPVCTKRLILKFAHCWTIKHHFQWTNSNSIKMRLDIYRQFSKEICTNHHIVRLVAVWLFLILLLVSFKWNEVQMQTLKRNIKSNNKFQRSFCDLVLWIVVPLLKCHGFCYCCCLIVCLISAFILWFVAVCVRGM